MGLCSNGQGEGLTCYIEQSVSVEFLRAVGYMLVLSVEMGGRKIQLDLESFRNN